MKSPTRKMLLNIAAGIAAAAAAMAAFVPAAQAAPGVTTANVNLRSGPGTNYAVLDTVLRGTTVDVQRCQGSWCYVEKPGPDGWISASYLTAGGRPVDPVRPGLSFGFSIGGPDGPTFDFGVNQPAPPVVRPPVTPPPVVRPPFGRPPEGRPPEGRPPFGRPPVGRPQASEVCFFEQSNFRGQSQCFEAGDSIRDLGRFSNRISSIDNRDRLSVEVCAMPNFRDCRTYTSSAGSLGVFDDQIRSLRISR